jgi:ubiquinone/menaquinone biosynthesis C-methylase UbiE
MKWFQKISRSARSNLHLNRPREVAILTRMMALNRQHRLLDVGCGDGYLTRMFARRAREVTGLDHDPEMLEIARQLHGRSNVRFDEGAAEKLPYPDASFDRVVAVSVMEHFYDTVSALREMARVLKPGGVVAMSVDSLVPENSPAKFRQWHTRRYNVAGYFRLEQLLNLIRVSGLTPDEQSVRSIHKSRCAGALRRCYMKHKAICFPLFPVFLALCRFSDLVGLGGRMPPQVLLVRARKPDGPIS